MIPFFRNLFQQVGFTPTDDFKPQLLENGGFDFGPLGTGAVGDDVYFKLVQNLQDSFALTAWQMVKEGTEPFSDVLTTKKFMMTTGLLSLYTQIEMPDDEPYNFSGGANTTAKLQWKLDYVNTIPLTDSLNPQQPQLHDLRRREADLVERVPAAADLPGRRRHGRDAEDGGDLRRRSTGLHEPDRRLRAAVPAPHRLHARGIRSWDSRTAGSTRRSRT